MKELILALIVLYICIEYPIILLGAAMILCGGYLASLFCNFAKKMPEPMEKSSIEEEKESESYNEEGKPVLDHHKHHQFPLNE